MIAKASCNNTRSCVSIFTVSILCSLSLSHAANVWGTINSMIGDMSPSSSPSFLSSDFPSAIPTAQPSINPTLTPTLQPSVRPSQEPSISPSLQPSSSPVINPSGSPSLSPSNFPTNSPSASPSSIPSFISEVPTFVPSNLPTSSPTIFHSLNPSLSHKPTMTIASRLRLRRFSVDLTLRIEVDEKIDEKGEESVKAVALKFASNCTKDDLSEEEIKTIGIDIQSQTIQSSFLDVSLKISGTTSTSAPDSVRNVLLDCIKSNKKDLNERIQLSLLTSPERGPPTTDDDSFNRMALTLLCTGTGLAVLVLAAIGFVFARRRRNDKAKDHFDNDDEFALDCEPKIRSFSPYTSNENIGESFQRATPYIKKHLDIPRITHDSGYGENISQIEYGYPKAQLPRYLSTKTCDVPPHIDMTNADIPRHISMEGDDEAQSKHTTISSVTDNNQYYSNWKPIAKNPFNLPPIDDEGYQSEIVDTQQTPGPFPVFNKDGIESTTTSIASSEILMGLNVPIKTALAAQRLSNQILHEARDTNSTSKESKKEVTAVVTREGLFGAMQDLCFVQGQDKLSNPDHDESTFNRRMLQTRMY